MVFPSELGNSLLWCLLEAQSCCFQRSLLCSLAKQVLVPQFPEFSNSFSEDPPHKNFPPPPPQCSYPIKLIPLMQLNFCFFTRGFSVGFYYERHQSLPQEQTLGLLGLAVTQSQQCWCISLHSTGLLSAGHSPSPALREFIPLDT